MGNQRLYYRLMDNKYVDDLIWQVESFLQSKENMICQRILCENSNYTVLQAKLRGGKIKQFIGMDKALTVRFICLEGRKLAIEMGEAKWGDKGAVMVVSMFVLWPLAITAGVGIYRQKKLPQKIIDVADGYHWKRKPCGFSAVKRNLARTNRESK